MGVTNRVYKVLVHTGGAAQTGVSALTAGTWVVTKKDGTAYSAGNTIAQSDTFQIVVGDQNGQPVFSDPIKVKDITSFAKQAYAAKTEQVITITTGTPVANQEYSLLVNNVSDKEILPMRQNLRRYTVLASSTDTATTIATAFYNKVNADPASVVTATNPSAGTVVLTAKSVANTVNLAGEYYDQVFFNAEISSVDTNGYFSSWGTVTLTTAPAFGSGNYYQVKTLEQYGLGYTGVTNRLLFPVETGNYLSVPGTDYDVYIIESLQSHESGLETVGRVAAPVTTIVAVTTGATTQWDALIAPLIQSAPTETLGAQI